MKKIDAAHAHGTDRIAVIGIGQGDEFRPLPGLPSGACFWYWKAILRAISTAVEPLSE